MFQPDANADTQLQKSPLNFIADALWEDFVAGRPIDGGVAFEKQLRKCKLDGSLGSLQRLDKLLLYIRGQLTQPYQIFMNDEKNRKLIWFIGFYVGNMLAKVWRSSPNWLGFNELNKRFGHLNIDQQNPFEFMALEYLPRSQHTTAEYKHLFFVLEPIGVRLFAHLEQPVSSVLGSTISPSIFDAVVNRLPPAIKQKIAAQQTNIAAKRTAQTELTAKQIGDNQAGENSETSNNNHSSNQHSISLMQALSQTTSHQSAHQHNAQSQNIPQGQSQRISQGQTQNNSTNQAKVQTVTNTKLGSSTDAALNRNAKFDDISKIVSNLSVGNVAAERALLRDAKASKNDTKKTAEPLVRKDDYSDLRAELVTIDAPLTQEGLGVQDYEQAAKVLDRFDQIIAKGQEEGRAAQQFKFSDAHLKARKQALILLNRAAKAGNTSAMLRLAIHYFLGEGIPKDEEKGFAWVQKAANDGDIRGQRQLSRLYYKGTGHAQDMDMGLYWLEKAAENGHQDAKVLIDQWNSTKTTLDEHRFEQTSDQRYIIVISMVVVVALIIVVLVRS